MKYKVTITARSYGSIEQLENTPATSTTSTDLDNEAEVVAFIAKEFIPDPPMGVVPGWIITDVSIKEVK